MNKKIEVDDCGSSHRTIHINTNDPYTIHIGCFSGTKEEAIKRIKKEYSLNSYASVKYIDKVEKCFYFVECNLKATLSTFEYLKYKMGIYGKSLSIDISDSLKDVISIINLFIMATGIFFIIVTTLHFKVIKDTDYLPYLVELDIFSKLYLLWGVLLLSKELFKFLKANINIKINKKG